MKKGSSYRFCHICGEKVMLMTPTGEEILGLRVMKSKCLPNYGGNDGKGYICKKCKEKTK